MADLVSLNRQGAGVFFMINRGDGQGRKAENITAIRAIFIDLDENGQKKLETIKSLTAGIPRLIVETSSGLVPRFLAHRWGFTA